MTSKVSPLRTPARVPVLVMAMLAAGASSAADLPRLWIATKPGNGQVIYVLGITHVGTAVEYDGYLEKRILPAAHRASAFFLEGVGPNREVNAEPACAVPFSDPESIATEAKARRELAELEFKSFQATRDEGIMFTRAPDVQLRALAELDARELSEIGVMGAYEIYTAAPALRASAARGSVAGTLLKTFAPGQVHDIDDDGAYAKAYCGMGPSRIRIFQARTLGRDLSKAPAADRQIADMTDATDKDFTATIRAHKAVGSLAIPADWDVPVTCSRNAQWLRRLAAQPAGSTVFLAAGVAHLFPAGEPPARCQGILQDLADQGYAVHLVD